MNTLRSDYYGRSVYGSSFDNPYSTWGGAYRSASPDNYNSSLAYAERLKKRSSDLDAYRTDSRDLYSYKHYRKSNQVRSAHNHVQAHICPSHSIQSL